MGDAPAIQSLITRFASRGEMLHRSLGEIYENLRNFFVVEEAEMVVACGALQISWDNLGWP